MQAEEKRVTESGWEGQPAKERGAFQRPFSCSAALYGSRWRVRQNKNVTRTRMGGFLAGSWLVSSGSKALGLVVARKRQESRGACEPCCRSLGREEGGWKRLGGRWAVGAVRFCNFRNTYASDQG